MSTKRKMGLSCLTLGITSCLIISVLLTLISLYLTILA